MPDIEKIREHLLTIAEHFAEKATQDSGAGGATLAMGPVKPALEAYWLTFPPEERPQRPAD